MNIRNIDRVKKNTTVLTTNNTNTDSSNSVSNNKESSINTNKSVPHLDAIESSNIHYMDSAEGSEKFPMIYILSHFPLPPWKCTLGMALTESDLSFRLVIYVFVII